MMQRTRYTTRSNAHRAAKAACRKALNAPRYIAYEGPDYEIRGPAADSLIGEQA